MTYIVVSSNEIVKADMERPHYSHYFHGGKAEKLYKLSMKMFEAHLASLPRISIEGEHKWEVWQSVPESEVGIKYEKRSWFSESFWLPSSKEEYDHIRPEIRRIVAIPIEQTKSDVIEIESNREYEKYCQELEAHWRDVDLILDYTDFNDSQKIKMIKEIVQSLNKKIKL